MRRFGRLAASLRPRTVRVPGAGPELLLFALLGCAEPSPPRAEILAPAEGAEISGASVQILLGATGVEIAPATEERPGTAHHHLFVDRDPTPLGDTIPAGVTGILHLGRGQDRFLLEGLPPGRHRVIAVLADRHHVPLPTGVPDTVHFTLLAADTVGNEGTPR